ncbi:MAG: hypothetical protein HY432_03235 [Candidatus Liptonbacteria bacterium]|nr:hypothetical protein [Candidatus Liptonbacteria bacterium]
MDIRSLPLFKKILLAVFIGLVFLYSFNQVNNADTFYDVKTGQYIVENLKIPTQDIFSLPAYGAMWVPHEWLAQIIFYFIYAAGGFSGLIIFSALLSALTYFILWNLSLRKGADFYLGTLLMFLLGYLTLELWVPRPQIFAYFSFAVLIYLLESYRRAPKNKYLIFSVLTIWFWANTNASFILGIVVIGFYFLSEIIGSRWSEWSVGRISFGAAKNLGFAAAASFFISFLTPSGYHGFLYSIYVQQVAGYLNVLEWRPITYFLYQFQAKFFIIILFLIDAFLAWWFWIRKESRDLTLLGLAIGISLLPFISIRHVGFWPIALFIPATVSLSLILKNFINRFSDKILPASLLVVGLIFLSNRIIWIPKTLIDKSIIPVEAADFIKENAIKGPLFNLYNEGGYLIFRMWPENKVFIDGRSEVYKDRPIIEFFTVFGVHPGWESLVDEKYDINYFFMDSYSHAGVKKFTEPLTKALLKKGFVLVYWDDLTILLVRDVHQNREVINKYGLRHIHPFLNPASIPEKDAKQAAAEIQSLLERFPQSSAIRNYAIDFISAHSGINFVPVY